MSAIGIIGGGAWGTALGQLAANNAHRVTLWARDATTVAAINESHENVRRLPGVRLHDGMTATTSLTKAGSQDILLIAIPAQQLRSVALQLAPTVAPQTPTIICAKGIERDTLKLMSEVIAETLPQAVPAALSGPSFAADVVRGLPTAITLAAADMTLAEILCPLFAGASFRPYASDDLCGVETGGAVKNVLAIACGIVAGRQLGASAAAALIARGFAEMTRLGLALGGRAETLAGLSGLGDLVLTASSTQSRNFSLGLDLGAGKTLDDAMAARGAVSEGAFTASAVTALAEKHGIDMPIAAAVNAIIGGRIGVDEAVASLMARPLRREGL